MNAAQKTLVGAGTAGAIAVAVMLMTHKTPQDALHAVAGRKAGRAAGLAVTPTATLFVDACGSTGNIAEAVFIWTSTTPAGDWVATGKPGQCSGFSIAADATYFHLTIRYPGGWEAYADGFVKNVTATPTSTATSTPTVTQTATITPTSTPQNTPTPCRDADHPYGVLRQVSYWFVCVNCAGAQVGVPNANGACGPPVVTPTPCRNSDHPYGIPQRSPYDTSVWWCVDCNGQQVGVPNMFNRCVSATATSTPTVAPARTVTVRPLGAPTRRPPIVVPFRTPRP
jgi:hypothetical protein